MDTQATDEELVERARTGPTDDVRPFEALVRRHQQYVMTNCRYVTRSNDAEDLAQEVFIKAYFALGRFEGRSRLKTWLGKIKLNHCLNYLARNKDRRPVDLDSPGVVADPRMRVEPRGQSRIEADEQRSRISHVLDSLPDRLRVPIVMREIDEMSYQAIADELGIGLSAVKMRIKRGREVFRERYSAAAADTATSGPSA